MGGHILPEVKRVIEAAAALYREVPDAPPVVLPSSLRNRSDAIAVLMVRAWWARQTPRLRIPVVRIGSSRTQGPHRVNSHPFAVLAPLILCPGATDVELAHTEKYVMEAIRGHVPGSRKGNVREKCRDSVKHWLGPVRQATHGYAIRPCGDRGYYYCVD